MRSDDRAVRQHALDLLRHSKTRTFLILNKIDLIRDKAALLPVIEEYRKLYDFTADAVKRALPAARVGGPATTGPARVQAAQFLRSFLEHCQRGPNYATGKSGVPLDFISFHAKGRTRIVEGHPEMAVSRHLNNLERGFEIVHRFPEFRRLPVVVTESDPEGCAACVASTHPENEYRNTPQYPSYEAEVFRKATKLADRYSINLAGVLTWAFEFEDQPYFACFRSLATNGIDLPVMNAFRVFGLLQGERIRADSTSATAFGAANSAMQCPGHVNAIATRGSRGLSVLVWNYADKGVISKWAVPSRVRFVEIIDKTSVGKLDKKLLRQKYSD